MASLLLRLKPKTVRRRNTLLGMEAYALQFHPKRQLLVSGQGMTIEEFLS